MNNNTATIKVADNSVTISYLGAVSSSWTIDNTLGNRGITLQSVGSNWMVVGRAN